MTDNYPNWFYKSKFKIFLAIIDSNKFNYKNKIGEFKYIGIKDLVNNIRNNTITEIYAKKGLNTLNKIKNAEIIKYEKHTPKQKELLNLFNDLLDTVFNWQNINVIKRWKWKWKSKWQNTNVIKWRWWSNGWKQKNITTKKLNDHLDKIIDKSKSFEDQIKSIKKVENLDEYYFINDFGDKELKFKIFKLKLAHLSNEIDEDLFEQIFDHKFETLANKLINTTNKEENQIIVNNINKNKEKLYEKDETSYGYVIQPGEWRVDLINAIKLILDFNETI